MSKQLTQKDWELISICIDGELSAREQTQFDKKIKQNALFKKAYEDARKTKFLVRKLPFKKSPYNFTLTPEMAKQARKPSLLVPFFSITSAISSIAAVFLLVFQFLPFFFASNQAVFSDNPEMKIVEDEPVILNWVNPETEGMGGGEPMMAQSDSANTFGEAIPTITAQTPPEIQPEIAAEDFAEEEVMEESIAQEAAPPAEMESEEIIEESEEQDIVSGVTEPEEEVQAMESNSYNGEYYERDIDEAAETVMPAQESDSILTQTDHTYPQSESNPILGLPSEEEAGQFIEQETAPGIDTTRKPNPLSLIPGLALLSIGITSAILAIIFYRRNSL